MTSLLARRPALPRAPCWPVPAAAGGGGSRSNPEGGRDSLWGGGHGDLCSRSQQRSCTPGETKAVSKHLLDTAGGGSTCSTGSARTRTHGSRTEAPAAAAAELVLTLAAREVETTSSRQAEDALAAGTLWGQEHLGHLEQLG